jgi:hypothetical protein
MPCRCHVRKGTFEDGRSLGPSAVTAAQAAHLACPIGRPGPDHLRRPGEHPLIPSISLRDAEVVPSACQNGSPIGSTSGDSQSLGHARRRQGDKQVTAATCPGPSQAGDAAQQIRQIWRGWSAALCGQRAVVGSQPRMGQRTHLRITCRACLARGRAQSDSCVWWS